MEGGMGLEEELISKKELLEQYRISFPYSSLIAMEAATVRGIPL